MPGAFIFNGTGVAVMPAATVSSSEQYGTDGNGVSVKGSQIDNTSWNKLAGEVSNVLASFGIPVNAAVVNQLSGILESGFAGVVANAAMSVVNDLNNPSLGWCVYTPSSINQPSGSHYGIVLSISSNGLVGSGAFTILQLAFDASSQAAPYFRCNIDNQSFNSWIQFATTPQISALQTQINVLIGEVNGLESSVGTLQSDVGILDSDVGTLQTNVSTLQTNLGTLQSNVTALEAEFAVYSDSNGNWKRTSPLTNGPPGAVWIELGGIVSVQPNTGATQVTLPYNGFPNKFLDIKGNLLSADLVSGVVVGFQNNAGLGAFTVGAAGSSAGPYGATWRAVGY